MTPVRRRPRHVIVAGAVLLTLTIASACAGHRADERTASAAAFDRALHDRLPAGILQRGAIRVGGNDPYPPAAFYAPTAGPSLASSPTWPPKWDGCSACASSSST
jgi:ABC-type amino acid transport substrate-binding protein